MKKDRYIDKKDRHTAMEADVCLFNLLTIKDYFFLSTA